MTAEVETASRPVRLQWVIWAVLAWCAFTIVAALVMFGQRSYLAAELVKANAKAKTPKVGYVGNAVDHDVSSVLRYGIIQSLLISVILALVTFTVLRGAGWARWLLIGFATILPVVIPVLGIGVVVQLLTGLFSEFPAVYKILEILAGLSAVAVVVILCLPEVRAYFSGVRAQEKAERRIQVRPAWGRAAAAGRPGAAAGRPGGLLSLLLGGRDARARPGAAGAAAGAGSQGATGRGRNASAADLPAAGAAGDVPTQTPATSRSSRGRGPAPKSREQ